MACAHGVASESPAKRSVAGRAKHRMATGMADGHLTLLGAAKLSARPSRDLPRTQFPAQTTNRLALMPESAATSNKNNT